MPRPKNAFFIKADLQKCRRCSSCELVCPSGVFSWEGERLVVEHPGRCIVCGHCVSVCPEGALSHSKIPPEKLEPVETEKLDAKGLTRLLRQRRSCRRFSPEPLSIEEIEELMDSARYAPTATNSQNVRYMVFSGPDELKRLADLTAGYYLHLVKVLSNPLSSFALRLTVGKKMVDAYRYRIPAIKEMFERVLAGDHRRLFHGAQTVVVFTATGMPHLASASCNLAAMQVMLGAHVRGLGSFYNGYVFTALARSRSNRRVLGMRPGDTAGAVLALGRQAVEYHKVPPRRARRIVTP